MILNIFFLIITIILIYLGYTYKAFIMFIFSMVVNNITYELYKFKSYKANFDEEKNSYTFSVFINDVEYKYIQPNIKYKHPKILAMSNGKNVTKEILSFLGPNFNFFGNKVCPMHLGFKNLYIWIDKKRFGFSSNTFIEFTVENLVKDDLSSDSD